MALNLVVRSGVALANKVLATLQPYVTYRAWLADDGYGNVTYADDVQYKAIVEMGPRRRRTQAGQEVSVKASVMFLFQLPVVTTSVIGAGFQSGAFEGDAFEMQPTSFAAESGTAAFQPFAFEGDAFESVVAGISREYPIDPRDVIILPDGTTGPIVNITGPPVDPGTNYVYFHEVWLGA